MKYAISSSSDQMFLLEPESYNEFNRLTDLVIEKYSAIVLERILSPIGSGSIILRVNRDVLRLNYDDFGGITLETGLCSKSFLAELLKYLEDIKWDNASRGSDPVP